MNSTTSPAPKGKSPSQEIDAIIKNQADWRGEKLSLLRALIKKAEPGLVEEVKWKKPSNPMGVPVWSHDGIICIGDALKNAVRLTFPKGAQMKDPKKLFNTRLYSNTVRAIDIHENNSVNDVALKNLIREAVSLPETRKPSLASRNESTETLFSQFISRAITSYHDGRSKMPAMRRRNRNRIIFLPLLRRTNRPSHGPTRGTDGTTNGTDYGTRLWHILCSRKTRPAV